MSELKGTKERTERSSTPASDTDLLLQTPNLEAERSNLLQKIFEEGGHAYVSMAKLGTGGDFRAAEAAREMAWEQLHSGPWHSVSPVWRDAYSMACLHVAAFHHGAGDSREALRVLDTGLIMGGSLLRQDLDLAVEKILKRSGSAKGVDGEEESVKKEFHLNCDGPNETQEISVRRLH